LVGAPPAAAEALSPGCADLRRGRAEPDAGEAAAGVEDAVPRQRRRDRHGGGERDRADRHHGACIIQPMVLASLALQLAATLMSPQPKAATVLAGQEGGPVKTF